jgi:hypothetical protein
MPAAIRNITPEWLKPENASVLDSPMQRIARKIGGLIGAGDPQSQVLGLMAPMETGAGGGILGAAQQWTKANRAIESANAYRGAKASNEAIKIPAWFTNSVDDANTYAGVRNPVTGADAPGRVGSQVQAVKISMQNPYEAGFAEIANATPVTVKRLQELGHDGMVYRNKGKEWYVPFSHEQIGSRFGK